MSKKTAEELCRSFPGAVSRRVDYIIALCQGSTHRTAQEIVATANTIIELTEQ